MMMHPLHKLLLCHVLTCLGRNALGAKIIDGTKAPENSMLYMASVQSDGHHICGGVLISKDFVLTAAHCTNPTTVVLGTHNLKRTYAVRKIVKKCKHPSYINVGTGNDIMLLKLSDEVPPDNKIQVIQLSHRNIQENEKCSVAGWGKTTTHSSVDELRVVNVSVISLQVCEEKWQEKWQQEQHEKLLHFPENIICAGGYKTTKGACQGDSGGPLVCNGKAVGIVSLNYDGNCNYPDVPNIYTDVSKFLPWINKILEEKGC